MESRILSRFPRIAIHCHAKFFASDVSLSSFPDDERTSLRVILPGIAVELVAAQLVLLQRIQRHRAKAAVLDGRGGHLRDFQLRG